MNWVFLFQSVLVIFMFMCIVANRIEIDKLNKRIDVLNRQVNYVEQLRLRKSR